MSNFIELGDLDVAGKRVLLRADLNVPMRDGVVSDVTRLERVAPTIGELADRGGRVVVLSHFGRPKGQRVPEMSLRPVADALQAVLGGRAVGFADDCIGPVAAAAVDGLGDGAVLVLENLRYHAGEEANDPGFAQDLAALGDVYVNDAFSAAHRAHASTVALARLLPRAAGRLMAEELTALSKALEVPRRPLVTIVGGAKISTKLDLLGNLIGKVDTLVIAGGMANTFLNALGIGVGRSLCEHDMAETAREINDRAAARGCQLVLPCDAVVAAKVAPGVATQTVAIDAVPDDQMILDAGPASVAQLNGMLDEAQTLVWNGPLGVFEVPPFDVATRAVAAHAAQLTDAGTLLSVAGGGDTVAALVQAGAAARFSYVSTAGGAFLEWLEGKTLPGVAALDA